MAILQATANKTTRPTEKPTDQAEKATAPRNKPRTVEYIKKDKSNF